MKTSFLVLFSLTLLLSVNVSAADPADYTGLVTIDSAEVRPGDHFGVKIWLRDNNIDISAMAIPLEFSSPFLSLDSVSLTSSIWGSEFEAYTYIDPIEQTAQITVLPAVLESPLPYLSFVDAVVAELFFSLSPSAVPHHVTIDSVYFDTVVAGGVHITTQVSISDNTGIGIFLPGFIPGDIEVLTPTSVDDLTEGSTLPTELELTQNYPNPFNPTTTIAFTLPQAGQVRMEVFNILGQNVASLLDDYLDAGPHEIVFDARNLSSGIYFYRIEHDLDAFTRKMVLLK
ncbi:MAG: hypothetical protein DRP45_05560 [Candidatus Zixiibacteriota bacterium]|nr:MAG: hypothetical protein DRP45_05560 [candidate division Zixibacteria bacterium]